MFERIVKILDNRAASYGDVCVQVAVAKKDEQWKLVAARFMPRHRSQGPHIERRLDYGDFMIISVQATLAEFRSLVMNGLKRLELKNIPPIDIGGISVDMGEEEYAPSGYAPLALTWPQNVFVCRPDPRSSVGAPWKALVNKEQPLFRDGISAIESEFGVQLRAKDGFYVWNNSVLVQLPRYDAKLTKLVISNEGVTVKVERLDYKGPILGKLYLEDEDQTRTVDFQVDKVEASVQMEHRPQRWMVYIFDPRGDVLDYRKLLYPHQVEDNRDILSYADVADFVLSLISAGESHQVEFKEDVKSGPQLVETVVAFANTTGGTILVGVG